MIDIQIVEKTISVQELKELAKQRFGNMVKGVVDIRLNIMAVGAELHADEEALLLTKGSNQEDLWGINIYLDDPKQPYWIEFDSMINIRPSQNNPSRDVENLEVRKTITDLVSKLVSS